MDEKRKQELRDLQTMAVDHAIEEMHAADTRGVSSKTDRGDRGFLTGMASKSLSVAVKIEQFIMLIERDQVPADADEEETTYAAHDRLVKRARSEVRKVLERAGARKPDA